MCLAIPGKVISIEESPDQIFRMGVVSFDGINREVNLAMVPEVMLVLRFKLWMRKKP
jgi:hydrogenase expression/formation protein HypC